jgi:glycosyltransferase involved in cell wall biosynthesis
MVAYTYYPEDVRIKKEAEALTKNGHDIDVICMRKEGEKREENLNGVCVIRLPLRRAREGGKFRYVYQYFLFFLLSFFAITFRHLRKKYAIIHAHSLPDYLVFTGAVPKLLGSKIILDLHEAMPEIALSKFGATKSGFLYRISVLTEQASAAYSDKIITVTDEIKTLLVSRGVKRDKISLLYNVPQALEFKIPWSGKKNRIVYAGSLYEYLDLETLLEAVAMVNDVELHIFGEGVLLARAMEIVAGKNLGARVYIHGRVTHDELIKKLPEFTAGIIPLRDTPITRLAVGNKVFEYVIAGIPVIASRLPAISGIFNDSCFYFYKPGSSESLSETIKKLISSQDEAVTKARNSQGVVIQRRLRWEDVELELNQLYRTLVAS